MKPRIFKDGEKWKLKIVGVEWECYLGWVGAVGFLEALYWSGDVRSIQRAARHNSAG